MRNVDISKKPPIKPIIGTWYSGILLQVFICIVPSMVLLSLGDYGLASRVFYILFGLGLSRALIRKNAPEITCFIVACLPGLMLLRDFYYYSSVQVFLFLGVAIWAFYARADLQWMLKGKVVKGLLIFCVIYWLLSFALTGDYSMNLRVFELAFSALSVRLLSRYRKYLATAVAGLAISGFSIGLALSGEGGRLGMIRNDSASVGNPVTFGMPMALIVVLCLADGGRWLRLEASPIRRTALAIVASAFLLLSTSRGSWSVAAVGILIMLFASRRRFDVLRYVLVGSIGVAIWAHFADTSMIEKYIYKTFYSNEEWSEVNARVAQWEAFPKAFIDAPIVGFGPGSGKPVSTYYSGHQLIWHSLYLHMGIECGSVGLILLFIFLGTIISQDIHHLHQFHEIAPLLGIMGLITIAFSIPGIDGVCGLFLGMGLSGGSGSKYRIVRTLYTRTIRRRLVQR